MTCRELADRAVGILGETEMAKGTLYSFVVCGFEPLLRELPQGADGEWSFAAAASTVRRIRAEYEQGAICTHSFLRRRKAAALMCELAETGAISGSKLPHYRDDNPVAMLFQPGPCLALAETGTGMYGLAARTAVEVDRAGLYQHKTQMNALASSLSRIVCFFCERGEREYSAGVLAEFTEGCEQAYSEGKISHPEIRFSRMAARVLASVAETGEVSWGVPKHGPKQPLRPELEALIEGFASSDVLEGLAESTVRLYANTARNLLRKVCESGAEVPGGMTPTVVRDAVTAARAEKGPNAVVSAGARALMRHIARQFPGTPDLSASVPPPPPRRRRAIKGLSADQAQALLRVPDRTTPTGMRDFAIMSLANSTGLRAIDIAGLKLADIDWHGDAIRIVQHKTGVALALPLDPETGNAIATYILEGRPETDDPAVFVKAHRPYTALEAPSINTIIKRHAGALDEKPGIPMGTTAFRREVGAGMRDAGVSLDDTRDILGHNWGSTTHGYIYPSARRAAKCALDLEGIPNGRSELA